MQPSESENISSQRVKKRRTNRISILNEEFDLSLVILIAQKRWKLLASIFLLAIIGAVIDLRYAPRIYEENSVIQVGSQNTANKILNRNFYISSIRPLHFITASPSVIMIVVRCMTAVHIIIDSRQF